MTFDDLASNETKNILLSPKWDNELKLSEYGPMKFKQKEPTITLSNLTQVAMT